MATPSSYARGRRFEYTVKDYLERHGATNVRRSLMSRGPWDLRCDMTGPAGDVVVLYIQCKANCSGYLAPDAWNALYDGAAAAGALPIVAFKTAKGRITLRLLEGRKSKRRSQPWVEWEME